MVGVAFEHHGKVKEWLSRPEQAEGNLIAAHTSDCNVLCSRAALLKLLMLRNQAGQSVCMCLCLPVHVHVLSYVGPTKVVLFFVFRKGSTSL